MTATSPLAIVILAAGKGTRMHSNLPKVMHAIASKPLIFHVIDTARMLQPTKLITVTGPEMASVREKITDSYPDIEHAIQHERLGTANAVSSALPQLQGFHGYVLILYGDTPLIHATTLESMLTHLSDKEACLTILGFHAKDPAEYGRLLLNDDGSLEAIVEFRDATPKQRAITLCNSGVIAIKSELLTRFLPEIRNSNSKGEFYLTDIVAVARCHGFKCHFLEAQEEEVLGINSRIQLAEAEAEIQHRLRKHAMNNGATLIDPSSVTLCSDTVIGKDVIIHPFVVIGPKVIIGDEVEIRSFSHIEGATIKKRAIIGPFARIRPFSTLEEEVHVGNFVEIKNSSLEAHTKANHLSYIGDAKIGSRVNIGAGTITCNYDGVNKSATIIKDDSFVGSNSCLVAPVTLGKNSMIAAGSVITKEVPDNALAISRSEQQILPGKATDILSKKRLAKKNKD